MILFYIYLGIVGIFLFVTVLMCGDGEQPKEIESIFDWLFYAILWPLIMLREFIKFIRKTFT